MLTSNIISGSLFLLNFILSAIYLGAGQGFMITLFAFISAFIVRNANILSTIKAKPTDFKFTFGDRFSNSSIRRIDETSPPGCVSSLAWLFLISTTIYMTVLIWPKL